MAIGRQGNVDDARADPCRVLRRKTETRERARTIALRENIRAREQVAQRAPSLFAPEFDKTGELAAASIDRQPRDLRQIGTRDQENIGAVRGKRAARDGT